MTLGVLYLFERLSDRLASERLKADFYIFLTIAPRHRIRPYRPWKHYALPGARYEARLQFRKFNDP